MPLDTPRKKRSFKLYTQGDDPSIDALAIITELLRELPPHEVRATLTFINDRFRTGRDVTDKHAAAE